MERALYYQKYGAIRSLSLSKLTHAPIPRNKVKLQAYQREYSQQKWVPGHRKVSKKEHAPLEEQWIQKHQLMETEGLPAYPKAAFVQYICYPFCHFTLIRTKSKALCVHTHFALTRGGPLVHSSNDTRGRTGSGILQGDQRHTVGSKTVAMFEGFGLSAMQRLI